MRALVPTCLLGALLLPGCAGPTFPELYIRDAATAGDITTVAEAADGAAEIEPGCAFAFASGDPVFVGWILPEGVPDPDVPAQLRIETSCTSETRDIPFSDGGALAVIDAPDGAEAGIVVTVSALNASGSCKTELLPGTTPMCPEDTGS